MEKIVVGFFIFANVVICINYVTNGGFELPVVPNGTDILEGAIGWTGSTYQVMNRYRTLGQGQYIDLEGLYGVNGYIQQAITLPAQGTCNLSFLQQANSTNYLSYVMEIYWNGQLLSTQIANTTQATYQSFSVDAVDGSNLLKFKEIGTSNDWAGMYLDEVSLTCEFVNTTNIQTNSTPSYGIKYFTAFMLSTIFSQAAGVRQAYLFAQDLWLYHYDKKSHGDALNLVFNVTATIQLMKFNVFERALNWQCLQKYLPVSDYLPYTNQKFIEIENSSSVLIKAVFPFFIYTIPENLLTCIVLHFTLKLLMDTKIGRLLRKFYFIRINLLQALIEGNVIYFVYVCFGHLSVSFFFMFGDKISLVLTIFFLWVISVFTFTFHPLIGKLLKKKSRYFVSSVHKCNSGYFYLNIRNLSRNFCRGAVFYFLHEFYLEELILLSIIEVVLIALTLFFQYQRRTFVQKIFYFYSLLYHFLFIFLNFSLYFSEVCHEDLKQAGLFLQSMSIYSLITLTAVTALTELLPLRWLRKRILVSPISNKKQQHQIRSSREAIIVVVKGSNNGQTHCPQKKNSNEFLNAHFLKNKNVRREKNHLLKVNYLNKQDNKCMQIGNNLRENKRASKLMKFQSQKSRSSERKKNILALIHNKSDKRAI